MDAILWLLIAYVAYVIVMPLDREHVPPRQPDNRMHFTSGKDQPWTECGIYENFAGTADVLSVTCGECKKTQMYWVYKDPDYAWRDRF